MFGGYDIFKEAKVRRFWAAEPESAFRALLLERLYPYLPNMQAQSLAYHKAFFHVRAEDLDNPMFSHLPRWEMTSRLKTFCSADASSGAARARRLRRLPRDAAAGVRRVAAVLPGAVPGNDDAPAGLHPLVAGRSDGDGPRRRGPLPVPRPPRGRVRRPGAAAAEDEGPAREVPAQARHRGTSCPRPSPDGPSSPTAPRTPRVSSAAGGSAPRRRSTSRRCSRRERIEEDGLFQPEAVERLVEKARRGDAIGFKDNMALVGILSTQLVVEQFIRNFTPPSDRVLDANGTETARGRPRARRWTPMP